MKKSNIDTKVFLGAALSTELKVLLGQSEAWQMELASKQESKGGINITRHLGEDYIGFFIPSGSFPANELPKHKRFFIEKLSSYCPTLDTKKLGIVIFPQVFIK